MPTLKYTIEVSVDANADVEEIESELKDLLIEMQESSDAEKVVVRSHTSSIDEDIYNLFDVIDRVDSEKIQDAIRVIRFLEHEA